MRAAEKNAKVQAVHTVCFDKADHFVEAIR
jgi:hypothetical protein